VSLRIAFDIDGVLADMESELARQAAVLGLKTHGLREALPSEPDVAAANDAETGPTEMPETADDVAPPALRLNLSPRRQRKLWRHVATIDSFWESLQEIEPGVVARLGAAAEERRWEVIFLTKRPRTAGPTAQMQTQRWLESKGFPRPSVFVVTRSRGRIASALELDVVVDDRPENCLDVVTDSSARAILVWRDDEAQLPATTRQLGVGVTKSTAECLDMLMTIESTPADRPTMLSRVKRLFSRKAPTNA
jgi:hypothetical protein